MVRRPIRGVLALFVAAILWLSASPAAAEVTVGFYSHSWGLSGGDLYFPHAFIVVKGELEGRAPPIEQSFGFTAITVSPALLLSRVPGQVIDSSRTYIPISRKHFDLVVSDEQYRDLLQAIADWQRVKGDPYELKKRNCITFVGQMARVLGLEVGDEHVMDPARFLDDLALRNPGKLRLGSAAANGAADTPASPGGVARTPEAAVPGSGSGVARF